MGIFDDDTPKPIEPIKVPEKPAPVYNPKPNYDPNYKPKRLRYTCIICDNSFDDKDEWFYHATEHDKKNLRR